ncbi:b3 domain-containing protein, partial [Quercus suber]
NLSSPTFLKLPNGAKWKVELTYHDGWKEFAECCSLKQGHLLVFRFEDNSHFDMLIFDETATKIDYPSNRPNCNEQGKVDEECESENSVQILSDSPQHPITRDTSLIS